MAARNVNLDYSTLVGTVEDLRKFLDIVDGKDDGVANMSFVGARVIVLREALSTEQLAAAIAATSKAKIV